MIELLRKSWVALCFFGGALYAQIPHAAYVFACSPYLGRVCPVGAAEDSLPHVYAYAVEGATLIFVVHRKRNASYGFAGASFLVNLCYYSMAGVQLFSWVALPSWLISALLPLAIAGYSHIAADVQESSLVAPLWATNLWASVRSRLSRTQTALVADDTQTHTPQLLVEIEPQPCIEPDTQPVIIDSTLPAQLDEMNARIIASISAGNYTPYAIHKDTGIALTTLKRKDKGKDTYSGRIPQLCAQGMIRNSSGVDGTEYRLAE